MRPSHTTPWNTLLLGTLLLAGMILISPHGQAQQQTPYGVSEIRVLVTWGKAPGTGSGSTVGTGTVMGSGSLLGSGSVMDGQISLTQGRIVVVREQNFTDEGDRLLEKVGRVIGFQSDITEERNGLFLRLLARDPANETLTIRFGDASSTSIRLQALGTSPNQVFALGEGITLSLEAEPALWIKGPLRTQAMQRFSSLITPCVQGGTSEQECRIQLREALEAARTQERQSIWAHLQREVLKLREQGWEDMPLHPDVLFVLGDRSLSEITRNTLGRMDLSLLRHMNEQVYRHLEKTVPERLTELPPLLREDAALYIDGRLPDQVRLLGRLSSEQEAAIRRAVLTLDPVERRAFVRMLSRLSATSWELIKPLDDRSLRILARLHLTFPETKRETLIARYARQATMLMNLRTKVGQVQSIMSAAHGTELENLLMRLEGTLLWSSEETPEILRQFDLFLSRSGALSRDAMGPALRTLANQVDMALAANAVGLAAEDAGMFRDVPADAWYAGFVGMLQRENRISGYKDTAGRPTGYFGPANAVTVGELLKLALETSGRTATTSGTGHWAQGYVGLGRTLNLSLLTEENLDLNRPATRAEVVRTFLEVFGVSPRSTDYTGFTDVLMNMPYAPAIEFARSHGIISGDDGKTTFRPLDPINRAEVAKIALRTEEVLGQLYLLTTLEGDLDADL